MVTLATAKTTLLYQGQYSSRETALIYGNLNKVGHGVRQCVGIKAKIEKFQLISKVK